MPRVLRALLPALVLIAAGLMAYANSFTGVFLFDDRPSIVDNPQVRHPAPWANPAAAMSAPRNVTVSGRPVASFTFALNYALAAPDVRNVFDPPPPGSLASADAFERNVWIYHATNLVIHLIAGLALFGVVRRSLRMPSLAPSFGAAAEPVAFLVALLWIVHPLQTGSVTYIVQRVESLMGMFLLLTLYAAIRANAARGAHRAAWTAGAVVACALGMGSKEVMVGAPLLVVTWDWTLIAQPFRQILARRWPLYLGLAATWILLGALVAMDPRPLSTGFGFAAWPWWTYFATETGVLLHYLRLAVYPSPLVLDYDWRAVASISQALGPGLVLTALGALTVWLLIRRRPAGFLGAWFFVILAPTSSVWPIITEVAAEHRMYLPLAAIVTLIVAGGFFLLRRQGAMATRAAFAAGLVAAGWCVTATAARNDDYATDARMWFDVVQKQPHNARARTNYAANLLKTGQATSAEEHLRVAVAEAPDYAEAHANLAVALVTQGHVKDALTHFERATTLNPFYTSVYENMGEAYGADGQLAKAAKWFLKALDQKPDDVALLNKAGWILATAVDPEARNGARAVELGRHAVALTERRDASSLDTLAVAYAEAGRFADAIIAGESALALARTNGDQRYPAELERRLAVYRAGKAFRQ